jgi:hypothetical protein
MPNGEKHPSHQKFDHGARAKSCIAVNLGSAGADEEPKDPLKAKADIGNVGGDPISMPNRHGMKKV